MAWTGLVLTVDGRNALNQAQLANEIYFKSIVIGDGAAPGNFQTQKSLVHQLFEITDIRIDVTDSGCDITADFPKSDEDYYYREIGVIVSTQDGDKLYVYDNCGDDAQHIVVSTGVESTKKRIRLSLIISDVAEINVTESGILYVSYDDFELAMENKVDKVEGKGLSANDYTDEEKSKLAGIAAGANKYTHPATHPATMITQDSDHRMVTDAEKAAWTGTYQQATAYVDSAIAELIGGAPSTLDTLKELADAMAENQSVVEALDQAIGTKANQAELDTHTGNDTVHITAPERQKWNKTIEDVSELYTKMEDNYQPLLLIPSRITMPSTTIEPGSASEITKDVSRTGYKPVGLLGVDVRNLGLKISSFEIKDGTNTVRLVVSSITSNSVTVSPFVHVLYQKVLP